MDKPAATAILAEQRRQRGLSSGRFDPTSTYHPNRETGLGDFAFFGPPVAGRLFTETPFSGAARRAAQRGGWAQWGDQALPERFTELREEVAATRQAAMVEDKSPLGKIHIHGPDAAEFVNRLIPRDVARIAVDHANYTPWCDDRGKIIVEGLLFRLSETDFMVTAGQMDRWLAERRSSLDAAFEDVTDRFGILALQGPDALAILQEATGADWGDLRFSRGRSAEVGGAGVHVWRTGFTGVRGYELWVPPGAGTDVWDALLDTPTGQSSIKPVGHTAQDLVRVEAGMVLPAIDYARAGPDAVQAHGYGLAGEEFERSPFELNLSRFVDFDKAAFAGRQALLAEQENPVGWRLRAMQVDSGQLMSAFAEQGEVPMIDGRVRRFPPMVLAADNAQVGWATSVGWSWTLNRLIGFAHVPVNLSEEPKLNLVWDQTEAPVSVPASLSDLPFIKPKRA